MAAISRVFGACRTLMAKAAATPAATVAGTGKEGKRILKSLPISQPLARFSGENELSRAAAVKKVREYVKLHNLQNPANKKEIQCDDKLKTLFDGKDKVGFTEVSKLLSPHFIKFSHQELLGSKDPPQVLPTSDHEESVLKQSGSVEKKKRFGADSWTDYRRRKHSGSLRPTHPDFKKKDGSVALWVNPILSSLEGLNFETDYWSNLHDNPEEWYDFRESKQNKLVPLRHPSFRKKDGSVGLWLDRAPKEILSRLKGLKFNIPVMAGEESSEAGEESCEAGEESSEANDQRTRDHWEDLLEKPDDWLDCRETKGRRLLPDFRKKDGNAVLWLDNAPSGILAKLKEVKFDIPVRAKDATGRKANGQKRSNNWPDLLKNPEGWWDYRERKKNGSVHPNHPDFKSKKTGQSLWLDECPSSVLKKLPPL